MDSIDFIETRCWRYGWLAVLTLALAILLHPYHSIGLMLALGLYVLIRRLSLARAFTQIAGIVLFALGLEAFWIVPLFAHAGSSMIPPTTTAISSFIA